MAEIRDAGIKKIRQKANLGADNDIGDVLQKAVNSLEMLMRNDMDSQKLNATVISLEMVLERVKDSNVTRNFLMVHDLSRMLITTIKWINSKERSRFGAKVATTTTDYYDQDLCGVSDYESQNENQSDSDNDSSIEDESEVNDEKESDESERDISTKKNEEEIVRKPYECDQCDMRFPTRSRLEEHKQSHLPLEDRKICACITCGKRFISNKSLERHLELHLDLEPKYKCYLCEKSYRHSSNLNSHLNTHEEDDKLKRPYECDVCGDRFACLASMKSHKKRKHIRDDPLFGNAECDICGKILSKHYALTEHRETHMADDDPRRTKYECGTCGKILATKSGLTIHEKTHLAENDPMLVEIKRQHTCNVCGYASLTAGALRGHMARHTGNKPFKCNICPKRFVYENELNKHLDAHEKGTVKKPHRRTKMCNLCPKKFVKKLDLDKHLKRHQEGIAGSSSEAEGEDLEQIYYCPKCPQKFRSEWKFKQHQLLHNGRKGGFKCNICGLTIASKAHLKKHIGRKHPEAVKNGESETRRGPALTKKPSRTNSESEKSEDVSATYGEDEKMDVSIRESDKDEKKT